LIVISPSQRVIFKSSSPNTAVVPVSLVVNSYVEPSITASTFSNTSTTLPETVVIVTANFCNSNSLPALLDTSIEPSSTLSLSSLVVSLGASTAFNDNSPASIVKLDNSPA
jgi:hypothetical protein